MEDKPSKLQTETLFDSLRHLFKQTSQLLMDSDRIMGDRGWDPTVSNVTAEYSGLPASSDRWFPRWAFRFYAPSKPSDESEDKIDTLKLVSVHFTSDHDTEVRESLLVAGYIKYLEPLKRDKVLKNGYGYWLCKSWFWGNKEKTFEKWHTWAHGNYYRDLMQSISTFALPLYEITSAEVLEQKVINRLFEEEP